MTSPEITYGELVRGQDRMARAIKVTGNRALLPIYKRLERELARRDQDDDVMVRVMEHVGRGPSYRPEL